MNNITRHYCLIDYDQQFAAIDQVCCRKVSFFKMAVPHRAIGPLQLRKLKRWAGNCYSICHTAQT